MDEGPVFSPAGILAWILAGMGVTLLLGGEVGARSVIISFILIYAIEFAAAYKKRKR